MSVSEEVRSRCHIKHSLPRYTTESIAQDNFLPENLQAQVQSAAATPNPSATNIDSVMGTGNNISNRRQKSWDLLDQSALAQARHNKQPTPQQVNFSCSVLFDLALASLMVFSFGYFTFRWTIRLCIRFFIVSFSYGI